MVTPTRFYGNIELAFSWNLIHDKVVKSLAIEPGNHELTELERAPE
jgi:hypothetical protein